MIVFRSIFFVRLYDQSSPNFAVLCTNSCTYSSLTMADVAMQDPEFAVDLDTTNDEILLAATNHDTEALKLLLRKGSARIQDPETGFSPLHAAIGSCEPDSDLKEDGVNGEGDAVHSNALSEDSYEGSAAAINGSSCSRA